MIIKQIKKTFTFQEGLAKPMSKSLYYNAWASVVEFFVLIFYTIYPAKTNQMGSVTYLCINNLMMIFANMYIHIAQKLPNYTVSILGLLFTEYLLIMETLVIYDLYTALLNACEAIFEYYERDGARVKFQSLGG